MYTTSLRTQTTSSPCSLQKIGGIWGPSVVRARERRKAERNYIAPRHALVGGGERRWRRGRKGMRGHEAINKRERRTKGRSRPARGKQTCRKHLFLPVCCP